MTKWKTNRTLFLVGEGYSEAAFFQHLKNLYVTRDGGLSVKIGNAKGKTAKHIIQWTIRQIANVHYDHVAVMLDTDTDWSPAIAKLAKSKKIQVLTSEPCFESLMLRILGENHQGDTNTLKQRFAPFVKNDSTVHDHYQEHFRDELLQQKRETESSIDTLLQLLNV